MRNSPVFNSHPSFAHLLISRLFAFNSKGLSEIRLKAAMGKLKVVSEDGIGSLLPLAPTLHKLVSLNWLEACARATHTTNSTFIVEILY